MSVVAAAAAAVGPAPVAAPTAVTYGLCGGGGGARKRKEVVRREEEVAAEEEEEYGRGGGDGAGAGGGHGLFVLETVEEEREAEAEAEGERERSSIGAASDGAEDEDEGEEAESRPETWRRKKKGAAGGLTCLDALDDALPIKRGLSSFFSGKSRSFANLQDVVGTTSGAKDVLAKPENPFNKRRRILRCCSIRRVSSTSLTALPPFLPPGPEPSFNDAMINGGNGGGGSG